MKTRAWVRRGAASIVIGEIPKNPPLRISGEISFAAECPL